MYLKKIPVRLREKEITHWEKEDYDWLAKQLEKLNTMGDLNYIFIKGR